MPAPRRGEEGREPAPSAGAIVAASLLAFAGLAVGLVLGGGDGGTRTLTVADVQTVTVGTTKTVTRTVTETITEPADDELRADEDTTDAIGDTTPSDDEGCSIDYLGACVPEDAPDVSCRDLTERRFDSVGSDPYGLDPDGDGIACE